MTQACVLEMYSVVYGNMLVTMLTNSVHKMNVGWFNGQIINGDILQFLCCTVLSYVYTFNR